MHLFLVLLYTGFSGLIATEFLLYPGVLANYLLPLSTLTLLVLAGLMAAALSSHFRSVKFKLKWLLHLNRFYYFPVASLAFITLSVIEFFTTQNYVFSNFGVNPNALVSAMVLGLSVEVLFSSKQDKKRYWQVYLLLSYVVAALALSIFNIELFKFLSLNASGKDDDNFVEWLQVIVLAVGVVVSIKALFQTKVVQIKTITVISILALIFLIGEEISWGERILGLVPNISGNNYQNELNIHNNQGINELTKVLYILAFFYAAISWLLRIIVSRTQATSQSLWWQLLSVNGSIVLYFFPTALFNPYADRSFFEGGPSLLDIYFNVGLIPAVLPAVSLLSLWRETFEVVFYAGIVLHLVHFYAWSQKQESKTVQCK